MQFKTERFPKQEETKEEHIIKGLLPQTLGKRPNLTGEMHLYHRATGRR